METKYTFWKLLNENFIEIPIIQRDYAQGRDTAKEIRTKLLDALYEVIKDENKSIELDFVYGRIKEGNFIPLDGQQRLTTLFLLHWYLALKENKLNEITSNIFKKFTYETRSSSREFCEKLVSQKFDLHNNNNKLTSTIKNQNWFFESWEKDPTIKSMLTMIDVIHEKFHKDFDSLFEKLISSDNPSITFQLLNLEKFELTDDLYIKMNARGKPLTAFENFKANFEKYLTNTEDKSKLDNSWTDLFWKYKDRNNVIDDRFFNFFTNITLAFYAENHELEKGMKIDDISIFDIYEAVYCNHENVINICKLLDVLSNETNYYIKNDFEVFIGFKEGDTINESESKLSYWDRARFYAIALFLIKNGNLTDENYEQFSNWKRVTFNLINNTLIQRPEEFVRAIKSLKNLSQHTNDIYNYLSGNDCKIDFYLQSQVEEEKIKANLMKDSDWQKAILNIENHWYFDGQIGFILSLSNDDNGQYAFQEFQDYATKCQAIFNKELLDSDEHLVQRALLAKGDYLVELGRNYTFCSSETALRTKNDNWRKVFNDPNKRALLKALFDEIHVNKVQDSLNSIIENFDADDWRKYFIKKPKIISYCKKFQTRFYAIENREDEYDILLLNSTQTNGYHAEYYTYALFITLVEQGLQDIKYQYQKSEAIPKSIKKGNEEIVWDANSQMFKFQEKEHSFDEMVNLWKPINV
ncbi:DUF262 domain-containing protein [Sulfuricurvum sp.]|uniref:DUF262 domain-containing protein n=1 Tax=Sulfuricurvum sp. TaxID=2025608 RepID=UPI0026349FEF|nr:DUF262 domain-containing protein [Sulfuricurvum sp.]MDD3596498.1 DUF262 domain-containing protein [Sulfuricurvum sp.]